MTFVVSYFVLLTDFLVSPAGIFIIYGDVLFEKFCNFAVFFIFVMISAYALKTVASQFELLLLIKSEVLFQWIYLWCDIEWNIVIGLLIEPEIFSLYGGTFGTFWFSFYCDSEHVLKFERALGQFLVRLNECLLQNISKDYFHI